MEKYVGIDRFFESFRTSDLDTELIKAVKQILENTPTADVEEVKHGEWKHKRATIDGNHYFCCSECGREVSVNMYDNPSVTRFYPYCHCGAKMDKKSEGKQCTQ